MNERKKLQRRVNKAVREINRSIERDALWNGRFYITQCGSQYYRYEDGSGGQLLIRFVFVDKKTGDYAIWYEDSVGILFCSGSRLGWKMNEFITEYCKVWEKEGRDVLYEDKTDYTKYLRVNVDWKNDEWCHRLKGN